MILCLYSRRSSGKKYSNIGSLNIDPKGLLLTMRTWVTLMLTTAGLMISADRTMAFLLELEISWAVSDVEDPVETPARTGSLAEQDPDGRDLGNRLRRIKLASNPSRTTSEIPQNRFQKEAQCCLSSSTRLMVVPCQEEEESSPAFSQSAWNFSMPISVNGWCTSFSMTAKGMVAISAPIKAASAT